MNSTPFDPPTEPGTMPPWARDVGAMAVDRYLLGPELGRGGMGRVHAAWDPVLKRVVAVKLLLGQDPDLHLRLLREARTQAKLDHPGICRIHDLGHAEGRPYIAMQLVQGRSLVDLRPELDFRAMAAVMAAVADAIHAAHQAGLIHRDLKPANILVETHADGSLAPCVVDFGLARDLTALDQTLSWAVLGTPAFMSPEQTQGEALGPATDIYSLGATLYALITGQPPYEGSTLAGLVTNQSDSGVRAVRRLNPAVPKDLETITLKCLEREPMKRYATARALGEDLRRFLAGEPILARPVGPLGRLWRWSKRRPTLAATAAAGILASALLLGWNGHIRATSSRRERAAQRFALEIRDAEHLLRIERMLPAHDIRPAETRLRTRMEAIRAEMHHLGASAQGPGYYALGRGHLALKEFQLARQELEQAWHSGFQAPEVAHGLGLSLLKQYETDSFQHMYHPQELSQLRKSRESLLPEIHLWMARAEGAKVDHPEYGAGLLAFVEGRSEEAQIHFSRALEQAPWLYEAWSSRALLPWSTQAYWNFQGDSHQLAERLQASLDDLRHAERLAPSDEDLLIQHAWALISSGTAHSARNDRKAAPFLEARHLLEVGLRIRPDSWPIQLGFFEVELQLGYLELSSGGDPRPRLTRVAQALGESLPRRNQGSRSDLSAPDANLLVLWTLVAEADLRFGRDPSPAFKEAEHWGERLPQGLHHSLLRLLQAKHLEDRRKDPSGLLRACVSELEHLASVTPAQNGYYRVCLGRALFELGRCLWDARGDGRAEIERTVSVLETVRQDDPNLAHTYYFLPRAHALLARMALAAGRDPWPHVRAALATGRQGRALSPHNVLLPYTEADAHLADGQVRAAQGQNPEPAWTAARESLDSAMRINPRDYRLYLLGAELELAAAATDPDRLNDAAAACRRGMALKRDEPRFLILLARIRSTARRAQTQSSLKFE